MGRAVPPLPYRKVAKALAKTGFVPVRQLIHRILREAWLQVDEFLDLV